MQKQIKEFNEKLVQDKKDFTIINYVKELNEKYFNIDISFIDDFIDMVNKEGFNISHEMFYKYEILVKTDSHDVLRILENNNFEDGVDYARSVTVIDGSSKNKNIYMMTSDVFKMICMRSLKTKKYAQYFILLEKCIKYYNDYQVLKLNDKINKISKVKLIELSNNKTLDNFVIVKCDVDTMIVTKYNNRKIVKSHDYITYSYALVKGQNKNIHNVMKECNLKVSNILIELEVPSHQNFTIRIKELLKDQFVRLVRYYKQISINGSDDRMYIDSIDDIDEDDEVKISVTRFFKLSDITEKEFIDKVYEIDKSRFCN